MRYSVKKEFDQYVVKDKYQPELFWGPYRAKKEAKEIADRLERIDCGEFDESPIPLDRQGKWVRQHNPSAA